MSTKAQVFVENDENSHNSIIKYRNDPKFLDRQV